MEQEAELPDAVRDTRRGTRVVGVGVDGHRRRRQVEVPCLLGRALRVETAGRDDDELRFEGGDFGPGRRIGGFGGPPEHILAASRLDHLGNPVARDERRIRPLGNEDAAPRPSGHGLPDLVDRCAHRRGKRLALLRDAEPARERLDRCGDAVERARVQRNHLGIDRTERRDVAPRDGTDRAEVLRDDDVGREVGKELLVECVEGAAVGDRLADCAVDLGAGQRGGIDPGCGNDREPPHLRRPVALLRHADERLGEAELGDDLGRAGEQRADAHRSRA
jgi:hypothetical protein